jgi:2-polyprenyl-6-methoxyphenol hydroxylase-like FAD-dependent oxidoreductase
MAAVNVQKPVLIAGAGLASLLLAQTLRRASIPFLIYERDASISFRGQGYRLRMSSLGLDAIESALGPDMFPKFWDKCGKTGGNSSGLNFINATENTVEQLEAAHAKIDAETKEVDTASKIPGGSLASRDGKTIGISRGDMRQLFMSGCEDSIQWSHKVTGYESTSTGVRLIFADGSKSEEGQMSRW